MSSKPRRTAEFDLTSVERTYRRGAFSEAAASLDAALDELPSAAFAEAALLRARIFLKSDPSAAVAFLARAKPRMRTNAERARAEMLLGVGYARLGDGRAANARLSAASALARGERALQTEITVQRALAAWIARDLDVAERELASVSDALEGDLLLEAYVARGAIAAARGKIVEQGAILLDAAQAVSAMDDPTVLARAVIASQLAYLARELPGAALRDAAYRESGNVPWTDDLAAFRFTSVRAIAWRHALDGDYFNAFRGFKESANVAPSQAWAVTATTDRAYLATVLGEPRWAEQELSEAHELARRVNWRSLDGEECFSLLDLAELFAPADASLALSYVARYKDAGTRFAATLASRDDRRVGAQEAYAFGVVQLALGDRAEAQRLLRGAFATYDAIGYDWRAGRTALALADATADAVWRERARAKLVAYPRSWLAVPDAPAGAAPTRLVLAAANAHDPAELALLTRAQRAVYELLLRGLSTAQIAAEQGRSEFTVRNHVKVIFKTFGVNSRPALLARASGHDRR